MTSIIKYRMTTEQPLQVSEIYNRLWGYEKPDITHMSSKESEYVLRDEKKEGFGVKKQDNMAGDFNDTEESSIYFEEPL